MLAYSVAAYYVNKYVRIGESIAIQSLRNYIKVIIAVFGDTYLRSPKSADIERLLHVNTVFGFPGMLGSIYCMH